jgi:hypothetical protein
MSEKVRITQEQILLSDETSFNSQLLQDSSLLDDTESKEEKKTPVLAVPPPPPPTTTKLPVVFSSSSSSSSSAPPPPPPLSLVTTSALLDGYRREIREIQTNTTLTLDEKLSRIQQLEDRMDSDDMSTSE